MTTATAAGVSTLATTKSLGAASGSPVRAATSWSGTSRRRRARGGPALLDG